MDAAAIFMAICGPPAHCDSGGRNGETNLGILARESPEKIGLVNVGDRVLWHPNVTFPGATRKQREILRGTRETKLSPGSSTLFTAIQPRSPGPAFMSIATRSKDRVPYS